MKIVLEDKDVILFKQKSVLVDKKEKRYSTEYTCSVGESDGQGIDWKLEKISAETLFGEICKISNRNMQHYIARHISNLFGFEMFEKEEQTETINVKQSKKGIVLEINDQLYTPEEFRKATLDYVDSLIPTVMD